MDSRSPAFVEDELRGNDDIPSAPLRHRHSRKSGSPLLVAKPERTNRGELARASNSCNIRRRT